MISAAIVFVVHCLLILVATLRSLVARSWLGVSAGVARFVLACFVVEWAFLSVLDFFLLARHDHVSNVAAATLTGALVSFSALILARRRIAMSAGEASAVNDAYSAWLVVAVIDALCAALVLAFLFTWG